MAASATLVALQTLLCCSPAILPSQILKLMQGGYHEGHSLGTFQEQNATLTSR